MATSIVAGLAAIIGAVVSNLFVFLQERQRLKRAADEATEADRKERERQQRAARQALYDARYSAYLEFTRVMNRVLVRLRAGESARTPMHQNTVSDAESLVQVVGSQEVITSLDDWTFRYLRGDDEPTLATYRDLFGLAARKDLETLRPETESDAG